MSRDSTVDLDAPRTYFDPHPGKQGAVMRIPEPLRLIAVDLVGKTLPLRTVIERLRATKEADEVWVVEQYRYVGALVKRKGAQHHYRVISYK